MLTPLSEVSYLQLGSRACLRALEAFGFLMLKYAFSSILETLFLSFLISSSTTKAYKNSALHYIFHEFEIFLCYYTLCKFVNLYNKLCI